jgi:hypothetical protein
VEAIYDADSVNLKDSTSPTVLFISRQGKRVLCAKKDSISCQLAQISTPIDEEIADDRNKFQTYDVVGSNIVICAIVGTKSVHATTAQNIDRMFETGEIPNWETRAIPVGAIEDFSLPISGQTVLLTATDTGRRIIAPTTIVWNESGIKITVNKGDCAYDLSRQAPAPLRVDADTGFVFAKHSNGGPDRLVITNIEQFDTRGFEDMISAITSGRFAPSAQASIAA